MISIGLLHATHAQDTVRRAPSPAVNNPSISPTEQTVADPAPIEISEVTVTASRIETPVERTGRVVHVVTADEIAQMPVTSADELLRFISGVEVQSRMGFGVQSDITIRGTTFNQTVVLVDGMRINDPLTGHFSGQIPVPLAAIDRVEVLTGAASGIYGPDAVGGVVNIITKNILPGRGEADGVREADVRLGYGSHETWRHEAYVRARTGKFRASFGSLMNRSAGEERENPNFMRNPVADSLHRSDFVVHTMMADLGYAVNDRWDIYAQAAMERRDFAAQYFYTVSTFDESRETIDGWWARTGATMRTDRHRLDIGFAVRQNRDVFAFNPQFTANEHTTRFLNLQVNHAWRLTDDFRLLSGLQGDRRSIESNDRGTHADLHLGAFTGFEWRPVDGLTLTPTFRVDIDENYGLETAPMLNAAYRRGKLVLRASVGRNYRNGDFTERFVSNGIETLSAGRNLGNPDLEAEAVWAYEGGLDLTPLTGIRLSATGFGRSARDLIDYIVTPASEISIDGGPVLEENADYFFAQNIADLRTAGLEASLMWDRMLPKNVRFMGQVGYLLVEHLNADALTSKYITGNAQQLVTARAGIRYKGYSATVSGLWKRRDADRAAAIGADITPEYFLINLQQSYTHPGTGLGVELAVYNLLNEQYADLLGAQMPGAWVVGGVRWSLQR